MDTLWQLIGLDDDDRDQVPIRPALQHSAALAGTLNLVAVLLWALPEWLGDWLVRDLLVGSQTASAALDTWGLGNPVLITAAVLAVCFLALGRLTDRFRTGPRRLHRALIAAVAATVVATWHVIVVVALLTLTLLAAVAFLAALAVAAVVAATILDEAAQQRIEADSQGRPPATSGTSETHITAPSDG